MKLNPFLRDFKDTEGGFGGTRARKLGQKILKTENPDENLGKPEKPQV